MVPLSCHLCTRWNGNDSLGNRLVVWVDPTVTDDIVRRDVHYRLHRRMLGIVKFVQLRNVSPHSVIVRNPNSGEMTLIYTIHIHLLVGNKILIEYRRGCANPRTWKIVCAEADKAKAAPTRESEMRSIVKAQELGDVRTLTSRGEF